MTIAEVLPNLKELQDTNKILINQLIHSHDEPHEWISKNSTHYSVFLNCVQTYENTRNMYAISHIKKLVKGDPLLKTFWAIC